jgi:ectoine hydroxylase-related dioxygenase (phytanoyl-CoA dioxygenase family)
MTVTSLTTTVQTHGYAVWPSFLDGPRLATLRRAADELLNTEHARRYPKSTRVWDLYLHGEPYVDVLCDERLASVLDALLGDGHLLSDVSLNQVNPGQPLDEWHIDYPYNEMPTLVSGALLGLQCVLALDRFAEYNGATQLIEGTHQVPRQPAGQAAAHVVYEAEPGSLLIMAAATWHRSGLNRSDRPRTAVLLSFVERWIKPMSAPTAGLVEPIPPRLRSLLGLETAAETINGIPI